MDKADIVIETTLSRLLQGSGIDPNNLGDLPEGTHKGSCAEFKLTENLFMRVYED